MSRWLFRGVAHIWSAPVGREAVVKRRWRIDITTEDGPSDGAAAAAQIGVAVNDLRLTAQGNRPGFSIKEVQVQREREPLLMEDHDIPGEPSSVFIYVTDPETGNTWQTRYTRQEVGVLGSLRDMDWGYLRFLEGKKRG